MEGTRLVELRLSSPDLTSEHKHDLEILYNQIHHGAFDKETVEEIRRSIADLEEDEDLDEEGGIFLYEGGEAEEASKLEFDNTDWEEGSLTRRKKRRREVPASPTFSQVILLPTTRVVG
jgi:hypothetical protein